MKLEAKENLKIYTLLSFFLFLFSLVIVKLFIIQVIFHEKNQTLAEKQYVSFIEIPSQRGNIRTADGYLIAGTQDKYMLYAEPKNVLDKNKLVNDLAKEISSAETTESKKQEVLFKEYFTKYSNLLNSNLLWVGLARNIDPILKEKIEKLGFTGVGFEDEPVRLYPEKTLASHVLGYVAYNDYGEKQGYFGIEGSFNEDLKGRSGRILQAMDAMGNPILAGGYTKIDSTPGRDLILTINRSIQYIIEKKLKEGVEKYKAKSGSVIVMDPLTGSIFALANYPTYDPSNFGGDEKEEIKNLAISQTYEPGSVIKPLTVSAALDLNLVSPGTTYTDGGPVWYSGHMVDNWDGKHLGVLNIVQLLQKSNNIGAAWVGDKLGPKRLYSYLKDFGIGKVTDVELEGEDTGIMRNYTEWRDIDTATASFGQGISATPLQVLNAFNSIANDGVALQPKIVDQIIDRDKAIKVPLKIKSRVISKKTSETMVDMLEQAASGGEAQFFVLKNYRIAGKTGTAQISIDGKYDANKTNATFVGFMAGSKKFSMIVKLEEPETSSFAAETAVPLWMEICSDLVNFFGLPPDKPNT